VENYLRAFGCIVFELLKDEYTLEVNNAILTKPISGLDKSFGLKPALNL
jgi:hypothetical protein